MSIDKKDIAIFGRVLISIGELIRDNPEKVAQVLDDLIEDRNEANKTSSEKIENLKELEAINLYEIAKDRNKEEMANSLKRYSAEQLKQILKINRLGTIRSKSVDVLAEYIADEVKKRTTDVFRDHV